MTLSAIRLHTGKSGMQEKEKKSNTHLDAFFVTRPLANEITVRKKNVGGEIRGPEGAFDLRWKK